MESHVQTLARAQASLGAKVHVICVNHEAQGGDDVTWRTAARTASREEKDGDVRVTRLGRVASVSRFDVCPALLDVMRELRRSAVDIIHVHAPNPTMFLGLMLVPPRAPVVVTHHSDVVKQRVLGLAYGTVERVVLAFAAELRGAPGEPLWLCVGRLVYYKGLKNAIDALTQVRGRLLVVGRGPLESELKAYARTRGVEDRVVWKAYLEPHRHVGAYLAATALWFPSNARSEGFGLAQVEAMASGCPVLNAAVPHSGVAWVSLHDESGLTFDVDDSASLAAAARKVADDPALRTRLARGARARAQREFDHLVMGRRSLDFYDDVLQAMGANRRSAGEARSSWA